MSPFVFVIMSSFVDLHTFISRVLPSSTMNRAALVEIFRYNLIASIHLPERQPQDIKDSSIVQVAVSLAHSHRRAVARTDKIAGHIANYTGD